MEILDMNSVKAVNGGFRPPTHIFPGMNARLALTTFRGMGLVGMAFGMGYSAGTYLAENTGIDEWIADAAWGLTH